MYGKVSYISKMYEMFTKVPTQSLRTNDKCPTSDQYTFPISYNLKYKTFIIVISFNKTHFRVATAPNSHGLLLFVYAYMRLCERTAILLRDCDINGLDRVLSFG